MLEIPLVLFFSTLVSEDLAFLYGLFAVVKSELSALDFFLFYGLGVLFGDLLLYLLGFITRFPRVTQSLPYLGSYLESLKKSSKTQRSFDHLDSFLILTRFLPGSRIPTYFYCGLTGYSPLRFSAILSLSTFVYAATSLLFVYGFKISQPDSLDFWTNILLVLLSALVTTLLFKIFIKAYLFHQRLGQIIKPLFYTLKRSFKPEFWPAPVIYLPLLGHFLVYYFRYGGFQSTLSANPAIYLSGMIGELKSDIDLLIQKHLPEKRLKTIVLSQSSSAQRRQQIKDSGLQFPFVLKPDSGLRGDKVHLVSSFEEIEDVLKRTTQVFLMQEYHSGTHEWGVYYYRYPGQHYGRLFSITDKYKPSVIGDGQSTLIELMLQKKSLLDRLDLIVKANPEMDFQSRPQKNQEIPLLFQGSHSKGCLFLDGKPYLESLSAKRIKESFDKLDGFYCGRVDIKFESFTALESGDFKILEINGIGAESTNIYAPNRSPLSIYQTLIDQWRICCEIGHLNHTQGKSKKLGLRHLLLSIYNYRRTLS